MTYLRDVISHCIWFIGNHQFLVDKFLKAANPVDLDNPTDNDKSATNNSTEEAYMATAFLSGLTRGRYGVLLNDLQNAFHMGRDKYPKTLTAAYDLAVKLKGDTKGTSVAPKYGVAFATESEEADVHATNGIKMTRSRKSVICHVCGKNHYANKCPYREESTTKKNHRRLRTPPRRKLPPKNHQSMLRSVKIGGMTLTMVVWCSTKLWWRLQRQKNFENGKIPACAKPVRRLYQTNLGPPGKSVHRQRVFKQASTEEYEEI